eukprot:NODE_5229_length_703_cov_21.870031_g4858_i0.p3 GENE.NODE_5229_length_703_cov_21.870031_g4858_i0~~NODE_5229_length_703_cov_21.870031_g4858_i0.p3  ORF type:complete len:142 (-),score=20.59 NODE_5229_length_703_cov_21.870031_g4858_i0:247-672(-)
MGCLQLFPGCVLVGFSTPSTLKATAENVLFVKLEDRGVAMITGCGHPGVVNLLDYVRHTVKSPLYAVYGGLHISPLGAWGDAEQKAVDALVAANPKWIACNHCTGEKAVEHMIEAGLPVQRGSGSHRSSPVFLGNGDRIVL